MLNTVNLLIFSITVVAHLVWYLEREDNSEQFPPRYLDGIDDAIWWATTTITTVGYGDKFPITSKGRVIGLIWMLFGLIIYNFAGTINSKMAEAAVQLQYLLLAT